MSYKKFDATQLTASKLAINLINTVDDVKELTVKDRANLKKNTLVLLQLKSNAVLLDNFIFNEVFAGLFSSAQIDNFMNYQKLLKAKKETTVYRRSYYMTHVSFRRKGHAQRFNRSYNKLSASEYSKVYITDMEKV